MRKAVYIPLASDKNAFGDDQPSATTSALDVVLLDEIGGISLRTPVACQRRHLDAVSQCVRSDLDGRQESLESGGHVKEEKCLNELLVWSAFRKCFYRTKVNEK